MGRPTPRTEAAATSQRWLQSTVLEPTVRDLHRLTSEIFPRFMLPSIMYHERKFEFQIAARKRAAGDQTATALLARIESPAARLGFFAAFTPRILSKLGHDSPFTIHKSRVTNPRTSKNRYTAIRISRNRHKTKPRPHF